MLNRLKLRLRALFRKTEMDRELDEELRFHLEKEVEQNLARGMNSEEARYAALRSFGGVERAKEESRDVRGVRFLEELWHDLRYAVRMLLRNPGFTTVILVTLAVGIGANTAIFSVINAVTLRQLPFIDPDRLVRLNESNPERGWPNFSVSHPNFLDWRAQNQTFEGMAATADASFNLSAGGDIEVIRGGVITADFLPVLRVSPAMGRNFLPEEDRPGGDTRVALIAYGFWQRQFGGDPAVVGKTLTINDNPFTVIGVLPESFPWGRGRLDLFVPLAPDPARSRGDHRLRVIGRLKADVTWEQALADMNTIAGQLAQQYPETNNGWLVGGQKFYDWFVPEQSRRSLLVIGGAVVFVLLIACSNVANLLMARATARRKEIAIRVALGAGHFRIIRQLLSEAILLALIAGGLGLIVAVWMVSVLKTMNPQNLPRLDELSIDGRVLTFALFISVATGVLFGLFPALQASRLDLNETLKEGGRSGGGTGRQRVRSTLVVVEVGLSVALLIGTGLLLRSFWKLQDVKPGFEPDHLLTMRINLPGNRYSDESQAGSFYSRLLEEAKATPGVQSAAITSLVPMGSGDTSSEVQIPGKPAMPDGSQPSASWRIVSPGYLRTLAIPLRGRDFDDRDTSNSPPVTIISEETARQYWPGEDPIGKTIILRSFGRKLFTIIGVAGDVRSFGLDTDSRPMAYVPLAAAATWKPMSLVVRTSIEPTSLAPSVRGVLRSIDANVPVYDVQTIEQLLYNSLGSRRFNMFLLGSFAGIALLLASVGLFGVMAYLVSQRTHEIGIRRALGAQATDVFKLVLQQGLVLALIGVGVGLVCALGLTQVMSSLLFEVSATDPVTFIIAPLMLVGIALLACYVPARRATRVDPIAALRYE